MPIRAQQPTYRLTTADPEVDLKRWATTPNDTIYGDDDDGRRKSFVENTRYTSEMLLSTLDLALQEIRNEAAHIKSLLEYAARPPYRARLRWNGEPNRKYLVMEASDFANVGREKLESVLFGAVEALDSLRCRAVALSQKNLGYKMDEARDGNWAEVADLLRLGAVDEGWVERKCRNLD